LRAIHGVDGPDAGILGHGQHEIGHARAESLAQLPGIRAALFDRVVQDAGRDHVVGRAGTVEQRGHLDGVLDEGSAVHLAQLPGVALLRVGERRAGSW